MNRRKFFGLAGLGALGALLPWKKEPEPLLLVPGGACELQLEDNRAAISDDFSLLPQRDVLPEAWAERFRGPLTATEIEARNADVVVGMQDMIEASLESISRDLAKRLDEHVRNSIWR